jgi:osmotically-inducible protein OsmY
MRFDRDIQLRVQEELKAEPELRSTDITVTVSGGVVTLTGFVRSFSQKCEAEVDAKRVDGVVGVTNDIEVRLPTTDRRPDPELAVATAAAMKQQLPYSWNLIRIAVNDGWIALGGEVEWNYQRERPEEAVRRLRGVRGITNAITKIPPSPEVRRKIEEAFRSNPEPGARQLRVDGS